MRRAIRHIAHLALLLPCLLSGLEVAAQEFVSVSTPTSLCAGHADTIGFGFDEANEVFIFGAIASLSHPDTVFLPDGVPCGNNGCSYRSRVSFSGFYPNSTITSAQDIRYVRLNMEHSYIKDLYINITCPNGQKAVLMRFGGKNTSSCSGAIPNSAVGWKIGDNLKGNESFGIPNSGANIAQPCNPNADGNGPGVGWNYCWSNNTIDGFSYASGDGVIYRNGHAHGATVDSSNVAAGTNFYHPDGNLNSLIGCPLNGDWYIEVVDGYSQDNGYIFDWEIALRPALVPGSCALTARGIDSPYVTALNDSTYIIAAPTDLEADTTVNMRLWMANSCGDTIDTIVPLSLYATRTSTDSIEAIDSYTTDGQTFTADTTLSLNLTSAVGCDSIATLHIKIWSGISETFDTTICNPQFPLQWRGHTFDAPGTAQLFFSTEHGADSLVSLTLAAAPEYDTSLAIDICHGQSCPLGDTLLLTSGLYHRTFATAQGCDSTVHLLLSVHPTFDTLISDTVCESTGRLFEGERLHASGLYSHIYRTAYGCDSTLRLSLSVVGLGLQARISAAPAVVTTESPTTRLTDASHNADARLWQIGDLAERTDYSFTLAYPTELDTLPIALIAYGTEACTDTARLTLTIDRAALAAPNIFCPSADEPNNLWRVANIDVEQMHIWIYNRTGNLEAELDGPSAAWDGSSTTGSPCPQGAYAYRCTYTTRAHPERTQTLTGTILLIR